MEGIFNLESIPDASPETWDAARRNVIVATHLRGMADELPKILDMLGMEPV